MFIVLGGRKCKPFVSLHLILGQTHTLLVTRAQLILGDCQPTFSGTPHSSDSFFDVVLLPPELQPVRLQGIRGEEQNPNQSENSTLRVS